MLAEHCWYQTAFPPPWRFRLQSHGDTTLHTTACEPADICSPASPCLQSVASPHRTKHALRAHLPLMEKRTHWFPAPLMVPPDTQCGLSLPNNTVWPNTRVPCQKHPVDDTRCLPSAAIHAALSPHRTKRAQRVHLPLAVTLAHWLTIPMVVPLEPQKHPQVHHRVSKHRVACRAFPPHPKRSMHYVCTFRWR
jgi:hypothetical protein